MSAASFLGRLNPFIFGVILGVSLLAIVVVFSAIIARIPPGAVRGAVTRLVVAPGRVLPRLVVAAGRLLTRLVVAPGRPLGRLRRDRGRLRRVRSRSNPPEPSTTGSDTGRAFRLLTRFTAGHHRTFIVGLLLLIFEAAAAVFEAYPLAYLIDYLKGDRGALTLSWISSPRIGTVLVLTTAVIAIAMIKSLADSMAEISLARGGRTLGFQLRVALYAHLQRLSLAFHDRRRTGDVITRVTGDVRELEEFVIRSASDIAGSVLLLVGTVVFLGFKSWQVTLVALMIIPGLALVSGYFTNRIKTAARKQRAREGDLASATQEMLTSIRVVQTFGRGDRDEARFSVESARAMDAALEAARLEAWFSGVVSVLQALSIAAVIWIGLWLVDRHAITVGMLVLFTILIGQMFKPTRRLIKEWNTIAKVYASVERIGELLDRQVTVRDEPGAVPAPQLRGAVTFENVSFAYELEPQDAAGDGAGIPREEALRQVSFAIAPGEVVALVGHSGAGKTTIAQLVPRLYDPLEGRVLLDGHDVRSFTLESLRSQVSMVLQETVLFAGTVAENIAYGRPDANREEIVAAAVRANADAFIQRLPEGYDTDLSERASNLSGGERQRIAIARAFIRDAPIVILDEPTTGLDTESTELVVQALGTLMNGKTTLVISHDPRLVRSADRILVLAAGAIAETGTHDELLEQSGLFAQLYGNELGVERASSRSRKPAAGAQKSARRVGAGPSPRAGNGRRHHFDARVAKLDPLRSTVLAEELPALEIALDAAAMRDQLQEALFGSNGNGWVIGRCEAGKAMYLPGEGCLVRYEVELRNGAGGDSCHALVGGRLFVDPRASEDFLQDRLAPLARLARKRSELTPFATPIAALESLGMAVYAYPIDADLPTLIPATDSRRMCKVFGKTLPHALDERLDVASCRARLTKYARRHRCVVRYDLDGTSAGSREPACRTLYGKVGADHPAEVETLHEALRERVHGGEKSHRLRIPRLLARVPELDLLLFEAIPGAPFSSQLLHGRSRAAERARADGVLEGVIDASARIVCALHMSGVAIGAARTLEAELEELRARVSIIESISPELGAHLAEWIARIEAQAERIERLPFSFSHGDFTHTQVVFDASAAGLVDLDDACQAEPSFDLGQFRAYLRVAYRKAEAKAAAEYGSRLRERFLDTYVRERDDDGSELLRARVDVYEALSLLRMAVSSWYKLKPSRIANALAALEEHMAACQTS